MSRGHGVFESFERVEKGLVHVEVLVRSETANEDDAGLARSHVAIRFVEFSVCWVRDWVIRFSWSHEYSLKMTVPADARAASGWLYSTILVCSTSGPG